MMYSFSALCSYTILETFTPSNNSGYLIMYKNGSCSSISDGQPGPSNWAGAITSSSNSSDSSNSGGVNINQNDISANNNGTNANDNGVNTNNGTATNNIGISTNNTGVATGGAVANVPLGSSKGSSMGSKFNSSIRITT